MRDVPVRPTAEDMQQYRTAAAVMLRSAIFSAVRTRAEDPLEIDIYAHAANALGDYAIARSRWVKFHQEDYL